MGDIPAIPQITWSVLSKNDIDGANAAAMISVLPKGTSDRFAPERPAHQREGKGNAGVLAGYRPRHDVHGRGHLQASRGRPGGWPRPSAGQPRAAWRSRSCRW